jgi:hypothetical protein
VADDFGFNAAQLIRVALQSGRIARILSFAPSPPYFRGGSCEPAEQQRRPNGVSSGLMIRPRIKSIKWI